MAIYNSDAALYPPELMEPIAAITMTERDFIATSSGLHGGAKTTG